jgi:hypothetical protein
MNPSPNSGLSKIVEHFKSTTPPLFGDREVHLHLGAHKTATTFIQDTLKDNGSLLTSKGVYFMPLSEMRAKRHETAKPLTGQILSLSQANRPSGQLPEMRRDILNSYQPDRLKNCHTVLISEENLSLYLNGFFNRNAYSEMADRLAHLREEIGPRLKVFFSIRDYPDFLSSVYVEILRHHHYLSFGDFLNGLCEDLPNLWTEAYHNLVQLFGEENVTIWDFNDTVKNPQAVLSMLTGGLGDLSIRDKPSRPSLSQKAVEFIRDFSKLPGETMMPQVITKMAGRLHPLTKMNSKFDPWTPREKRILREHYNAEKLTIPVRSFND